MLPEASHTASAPLEQDRSGSKADVVSALTARIDAIDAYLRTTREIVDEKSLKELRRTIDSLSKRDPKFEERVTNTVGVLTDRVETVAKTVSTSSAALAAKDGEIVQLRRELTAALQQVDASLREAGRGADPAELVEIRRALDDLSKETKQRMPRGLEGRIEELAAKFTLIGQRVDSLSSTVSTTAGGLSAREGDLNAFRRSFQTEIDRISTELAEQRRANDPRAITDLRDELKELAAETARKQHADRQLIGQAAAKLDAVSERLDALTTSQASTSNKVSATDEHLTALRAYLEDNGARVNALLAEHRQALVTLSSQTAAREESESETSRILGERIAAASDRIDDLVERVDPLSAAVVSTGERLDARDVALETLEHQFTEARSRVDELVGTLAQALAEFPDPNSVAHELTPRIDELAERTASLAQQLARVESSVDEQLRTSVSASAELERSVAGEREAMSELAARLDALATSLAPIADRVSGAEELLLALDSQVDETGRLGPLVAEQEQLLAALAARTASLEQTEDAAARVLDERVADVRHELDRLARRLESLDTSSASSAARVSGTEEAMAELRAYVEDAGGRLSSLLADHKQSLAALGARTAALEQADDDVTQILDERVSAASARIDELASQLDPLAASVESAVTGLAEKERELAAAHSHFTESSSRVETIAEDIREALHAFPDAAPDALATLASKLDTTVADMASLAGRLERVEAVHVDRVATDLGERLDRIDARIAAVAAEMGRAKTLWPVALRSLEARLDDLVERPHRTEPDDGEARLRVEPVEGSAEDLLAGLRDGLHAMESVAEEMARASEAWAADDPPQSPENHEAATAGATVVPLRTAEP